MLVKELIGKLNSYNMDAEVKFERGNDFEIDIVPNEAEVITDNGNTQAIIFRIVNKTEPEPITEPATPPEPESTQE